MHGLDETDSKARWYYPAIKERISKDENKPDKKK